LAGSPATELLSIPENIGYAPEKRLVATVWDRWFADSPLEGGVYCELVSEVGLRRLANKARFQGVYG